MADKPEIDSEGRYHVWRPMMRHRKNDTVYFEKCLICGARRYGDKITYPVPRGSKKRSSGELK